MEPNMPLMLFTRRREPKLIGPTSLPMALLRPHEDQVQRTHSQSLDTLKRRGGLDPIEALGIIEGWSPYKSVNKDRETRQSALSKLAELLKEDV